MDDGNPVRWGILSTADIGVKKVIPAIQAAPNAEVIAIGSRHGDRAAAVAEDLGIPTAHASYEELLADPRVDAVYNPLPNHLHLDWTVAAAEAGKHVLCEKPLGMDARQARQMVDACAGAGVKLMEAFMYRLHPMWVETKRMVDEGAIGELVAVDTIFSYFNDDPTNIRNIAETGGGALYDIGCYAVNSARLLFGSEPTDVVASMRRDEASGTDVLTSAILRFGEGVASLTCGTRMEPDQRVTAYGTEGRIVVEIPFNIPLDVPARIFEVRGRRPPEDLDVTVHEFPPTNQYVVEAEAFSRSIQTGEPVPIPPGDAVANMEVIDRIFRASG